MPRLRGVYYRRILWLLVIGAVHAYLIWSGDILFLYAECGLILYLFRNEDAEDPHHRGLTLMLLIVPLVLGFGAAIDGMKAVTARVDAQIKAGETPSRFDRRIHDIWTDNLQKEFKPNPEQKAKDWNEEMAAYRGGYLGIVKHRAFDLLMEQTVGFLLGGFFFAGARMLLGMGLMKLGVFSAERSRSFYLWMAALGYGIGLPLMVFDAVQLIRHEFKSEYMLQGGIFYNAFGSLIVALGHVGLIMLIVQSGRPDLADKPAGGRGPDGPVELPDPLDRLHDALLRLWLRPLRPDQPHRPGRDRARHLATSALAQPHLAGALPLRPRGVGLAVADLLEAAADETARDGAGVSRELSSEPGNVSS